VVLDNVGKGTEIVDVTAIAVQTKRISIAGKDEEGAAVVKNVKVDAKFDGPAQQLQHKPRDVQAKDRIVQIMSVAKLKIKN